jgi:hypothetical protein
MDRYVMAILFIVCCVLASGQPRLQDRVLARTRGARNSTRLADELERAWAKNEALLGKLSDLASKTTTLVTRNAELASKVVDLAASGAPDGTGASSQRQRHHTERRVISRHQGRSDAAVASLGEDMASAFAAAVTAGDAAMAAAAAADARAGTRRRGAAKTVEQRAAWRVGSADAADSEAAVLAEEDAAVAAGAAGPAPTDAREHDALDAAHHHARHVDALPADAGGAVADTDEGRGGRHGRRRHGD